jgi:hypothetical protein
MKHIKAQNTKITPKGQNLVYRFNIRQRLASITPVRSQNIKQFVIQSTGRSKSTLYRVINAKHSEDVLVDVKILLAFAHAFETTVEELQNPKPL